MTGLLDLPPEILDVLADHLPNEKFDELRWDQFPLTSYAEDSHSTNASRILANLTQVNSHLRHHFKPILWRDITIYYISDIEKLDRFLAKAPPDTYGKYVRSVRFSWWDDIVGNEFQAEHDISSYEEEDLGLGPMREWIFRDRTIWWQDVFKGQLREWNPGWTEEQVEEAANEPSDYPYTSGPDGRGPVPRITCMADVEQALQKMFGTITSLKHLDWNSRLLPFPAWLPPLAEKLQSLVLLHEELDGDHCSPLIHSCRHIQSLTLLDFKHDFFSYDDLKIECGNLHFCPPSRTSPLGVMYDGQQGSDRRLQTLCRSLIEGTCYLLRTLALSDWNILRVKKLLPVFIALESVSAAETDWFSESCSDAPFAALKDLRTALRSYQTIEDILKTCEHLRHRKSTREESRKSEALDIHEFAQWIVDDRMLAERVLIAIERHRIQ